MSNIDVESEYLLYTLEIHVFRRIVKYSLPTSIFPMEILIFLSILTYQCTKDSRTRTRQNHLVLCVLVMFHIPKSIDLSREVLTLWGHKKFYLLVVKVRYRVLIFKYFRIGFTP